MEFTHWASRHPIGKAWKHILYGVPYLTPYNPSTHNAMQRLPQTTQILCAELLQQCAAALEKVVSTHFNPPPSGD